jgi:hypothetical protein
MLINVRTVAERAPRTLTGRVQATLRYRLARFSGAVARIEVHVSEPALDARRIGTRCRIEIQPRGLAPVAVAQDGLTFEQALAGAAAKSVRLLDRLLSKLGPDRQF